MHTGAAHGLVYPPGLPSSLPELSPHVRLLSAKTFEQLYLSHILAHPQDHVLFPFLHGLEGENEAQNSFFATAPNARDTHFFLNPQKPRVKVPKYRGLVCVVCEEDIEADGDLVSLRLLRRKNGPTVTAPSPSSSTYSTSSESFDDDFDMEGFSNSTNQDNHICVAGSDERTVLHQHSALFNEQAKDKIVSPDPNSQSHMHPISHRTVHPPLPVPLTLPSSLSSSTSASSGTSFLFDNSTPSPSSLTDSSAPLGLDAAPEGCLLGSASDVKSGALLPPAKVTDPAAPPLITGTFRPKELLRRVKAQGGSLEWEFAPANVPNGISLRNFGIQVPIYATISDIVVYSPKGASSAAINLGKRFARAIEIKRQERLQSLGFSALPDEEDIHGLLKYNVFVLDATEEDMKKDLSHLMMRICVEPVTGGLFGRRIHTHGAHTDGPDGHVVELLKSEPSRETSGDVIDLMAMDVDSPSLTPTGQVLSDRLCHNTVDFAQREKEEMRDLTKASEIISLFPMSLTNTPVGSPGISSREERTNIPQQRHRSHSFASSHHPYRSTRPSHLQFLPQIQPPIAHQQNFTFSPPLTSNIDFSSTLSYFNPVVGQVFLGNSSDVPSAPETNDTEDSLFEFDGTNDPKRGLGFDICIECHELATFPSAAHLRKADEHLSTLDLLWTEKYERQMQERFDSGQEVEEGDILPRPPPNARAVIHLTLPSSPANTQATMSSLMPVIRFLEKWLRPVIPPTYTLARPPSPSPPLLPPVPSQSSSYTTDNPSARRWSSFMPSFGPFTSSASRLSLSSGSTPATTILPIRNRSLTSPSTVPIPATLKPRPRPQPTRPLKILMYSSDGYTESSVPALSLLMAVRGFDLPEAYLELQVAKRRSFFVYSSDLGILRRIEARLKEDRERISGAHSSVGSTDVGRGKRGSLRGVGVGNRPTAKSVSFATLPPISGMIRLPTVMVQPQPLASSDIVQKQVHMLQEVTTLEENSTTTWEMEAMSQDGNVNSPITNGGPCSGSILKGRPRAKTSPWLPSTFSGDHQAWFNDPRFDGSFPSRVLPFLYLGNLNHAANAYMLHALGITHVVSVGECALVPPPTPSPPSAEDGGHYDMAAVTSGTYSCSAPSVHYDAGKESWMQGNLWIEEREGRIKVLDIKGVCDDGIDTLEPQLGPICEWIDKARQDGGQVLVHCRVGVSRSATVTIAYVMKYLNLPLVDAYLIVRSRRLSVLIQPNMRLLYNLCGWEIKLARERAGGDESRLKQELSRTLSWPYLAKEVHALNEKYLH